MKSIDVGETSFLSNSIFFAITVDGLNDEKKSDD